MSCSVYRRSGLLATPTKKEKKRKKQDEIKKKSDNSIRGLQPNTFALLAAGQLNRPTQYAALCRFPWLTFMDKEPPFRPKAIPTFMTHKTSLMPLTANCSDNDLVKNRLLTAETAGCGATRMAPQTPCESFLLYKRCGRRKGLENQHMRQSARFRTS